MAKRKICQAMAVVLALGMCTTGLTGCGNEKRADGKTEIEVVSYKPEAVKAFEKIEKQFNETHDDIHLTISSPNEAMTILKTRFIREDYPDISHAENSRPISGKNWIVFRRMSMRGRRTATAAGDVSTALISNSGSSGARR